jgi:ribonuclease III
LIRTIAKIFSGDNEKDKQLRKAVASIIGESPSNLSLYKLAFMHSSAGKNTAVEGFRESNERLEYLGDSVIGMVVAEYLFKKFPYKDEGFLTDMRSRIVSRESLNTLAKKLGVDKLIDFDLNKKQVVARTSMFGDAMEALIGAVYVDKGFRTSRRFIIKKILTAHFDVDSLSQTTANYKSLLIEWAQKEGKKLQWNMVEQGQYHNKEFTASIVVDADTAALSSGNGHSKKKAEQDAARRACVLLELV